LALSDLKRFVPIKSSEEPQPAVIPLRDTPDARDGIQAVFGNASLLLGEAGATVFQILSGKGSLNSKLRRACETLPEAWTWTSDKWAALTGKSDSAVRQTDFWRVERKRQWAATIAKYRDENPDGELPSELRKFANNDE
jgi:hypothetical protein